MRRSVPAGLALLFLFSVLETDAQEKVQRTEAEQKAIAKIRQLGGLALELAQNDPRLEVSYLQHDAKFGTAHLEPLKELKTLVHLNLRGQDVTDEQAAHLKGLTTLTRLHLEKTKIGDKSLEQLKGLANLEYLNLYGTAVSDAGLVHLHGMKKLKSLYLWQTKVTDAGVQQLKKSLPQVDIVLGLDLGKPVDDKKPADKKPAEKPKDKKKKKDDKKPEPPKKDDKKPEPPKKDDKKPAKSEEKKP